MLVNQITTLGGGINTLNFSDRKNGKNLDDAADDSAISLVLCPSECTLSGNFNFKYKLLVFCFCFFSSVFSFSASVVADSICFRVLFPVDTASIQTEFFDNGELLKKFSTTFDKIIKDENVSDILITIRGNASSEGFANRNNALARNRALSLYDYLINTVLIPDSLIKVLPEQPLLVEAENVLATFPDTIDGIDINSIRRISRTTIGSQLRQVFHQLDGGSDGANWKWYKENVLTPLRFAEIRMSFNRKTPDSQPEIIPVATQPQSKPQTEEYQQPATQALMTDSAREYNKVILLKNNLLYDIALVANIGVEFGLNRHLSLDIPLTFSPYNITYKFRLRSLTIQPALRYWFGETMSGLFASLYGNFGYYDIGLGGKTRWQNSWKKPLYGGGAGFGYAKRFGKGNKWGIEAEIGFGYAHLPSDYFYNIPNGAQYHSNTKNYWGPTKANVGISYIIWSKTKKSIHN